MESHHKKSSLYDTSVPYSYRKGYTWAGTTANELMAIWQGLPCIKHNNGQIWLAELLANKHAVGSLLEFLKSTEVGNREGTAERMAEWGQRRDQDGEDRLGGW